MIDKEQEKKNRHQQEAIDKALKADMGISKDQLKELKKKLSKVEPRAERGAETLFRLVSKNQYSLKAMIDRKSKILITANSIILSIIIGTVLNQLKTDPHLIYPVVIMLFTNLFSIAFAIFATRSELTHGDESAKNIMFFGNFQNLEEKDYIDRLTGLMYKNDELYKTIARDTYYLGKELERLYGHLRISFNIFLMGIFIAVAAFVSCHTFF